MSGRDMAVKAEFKSAKLLLKKNKSRHSRNLSLEQRRELTIRRVATLFLKRGYENISMNDIIDAAGGSKTTVYTLFGNKEGLFQEVVRWLAAETSMSTDLSGSSGTIDTQLKAMGKAFLQTVLQPEIIELHRLMVSLGRTFPAITGGFFRAGPANAYRHVAEWIAEQQKAGHLRPGDPAQLAALFLDMLIGEFQLGILTGAERVPTTKQIEARVAMAVDVFLGGCDGEARHVAHSPASAVRRDPERM